MRIACKPLVAVLGKLGVEAFDHLFLTVVMKVGLSFEQLPKQITGWLIPPQLPSSRTETNQTDSVRVFFPCKLRIVPGSGKCHEEC